MHHNPGLLVTLGMAIAGNMRATVEDGNAVTSFGQFATNHGTGKTSPNKQYIHAQLLLNWLKKRFPSDAEKTN
jgi:hypothetical protein